MPSALPTQTPDRLAIIAGSGRFPFHVADAAKRQGWFVSILAIQEWADPSLASHADAYEEIAIGQIGRLISRLKAQDIRQAILAGKVTKAVLLNRAAFDLEAIGLLFKARDLSVSALLKAIGQRLAQEGITLLDSSMFLPSSLCPEGALTARRPTESEQADIEVGRRAARALASVDVGQTVVVKGRVVVAVEALEGTDATIQRAHAIAGDGLVVVKMASPNQDRRLDLPVVGTDTLDTLRRHGVTCLAVEASATILLDRDTLLASANAAGLCLIGIAS